MANVESDRDKVLERLGKLQDYFAEYQSIPSYRFMQDLLGIRSKEAIGQFIGALKEQGFLEQAPDKKLFPGERFFERHSSNNTAQAGGFTQMVSEGGRYLSIDRILIPKPSITEIIPVRGDSMKDKGLLDGDSVIVQRRSLVEVGEIVVAIVRDEQTIKTLGRENGKRILIPANKHFEIIRPKEDFLIYGVVTGSFRTYK